MCEKNVCNQAQGSWGATISGAALDQIQPGHILKSPLEQACGGSDGEPTVIAEVKIPARDNFAAGMFHCIQKMGKATREGWNGVGMHIEAQWPDPNSKMGRPYLYITDAMGVRTPWVPSQGDLFATDWALLPDNYIYQPF